MPTMLIRSFAGVFVFAVMLFSASNNVRAQGGEGYYYGIVEITPGIRLTPEFGAFRVRVGVSRDVRLGSDVRPDGTFTVSIVQPARPEPLLVERVAGPGLPGEFFPEATIYATIPPFTPVQNLGYYLTPRIGPNQLVEPPLIYLGPGRNWTNVGTIVLTKPGSVSGRITIDSSSSISMTDLVVSLPRFGLVTKPNPDGGYLLTGVPPGQWQVQLIGPQLPRTSRTTKQATVDAMTPTVGIDFEIRGINSQGNGQTEVFQVPPPSQTPEGAPSQDQKKPATEPEKKDKPKSVIKGILDNLPKKP